MVILFLTYSIIAANIVPVPPVARAKGAHSSPNVIAQSVGVVGKDVITLREVQIAVAISRILDHTNPKEAPILEIQLGDTKFSDSVSNYLIDRGALLEAESFGVGKPEEALVKENIVKIEKATTGKSYWQGLEVDAATLRRVLLAKMMAQNFIKVKSDSMSSIVTDSEALAYFEKNRLKFGESAFDTFKENIKTYLAQQQKQERLRGWFEVLKKKYKIRNLLLEDAKSHQPAGDSQNQTPGK